MGHGIAQVSAMGGHDVYIRDIEESIVDEGLDAIEANLQGGVDRDKLTEEQMADTLDRLTGTTDLKEATDGTSIVVEAVPENIDLKKNILSDVEEQVSADTVLASNTSSLAVTEIMSTLETPERGVGLHFFNPVHIMKLVEIVHAEQTSAETKSLVKEFIEGIDKVPIEVRDSPGFASSRLGVALGVEAIRMVQEGVAEPEDIDTAMELGYNHPMGPIELSDVVGLDVRLDILNYLREELGERFRPPQLLKRKVRAGKLGKKTGEGLYVWEDGEIVGVSGDVGEN
ncbi:3-hydroxybutyryl-CoA dehydrogenase [Halogranum amylolyticum]|uniref:3-hydroxybutyryl-CoA dehydrogenase n=2 Tax=Halogranum amylolyticum TaxID=660520 RepID=A0A1H8WQX1_9EURY|nr:3-hydroxybutyryl-CoA dehydrogenase [Halogranum amylolyticum]